NTMYGGFKERGADIYNLDVKDGSYLRSAARIGAGVDYEKDIWIWYANIEGKYMIEGAKSEIRSGFDGIEEEFNSRGAEEGKMQIGIGAGAEIEVALNWKIFANAKYYTGERYENLYGNAGVRYMFGNKKRLPNEDAEKQYNKAQKLYNKGEYLRATDMLSEMIVTNPGFEPPKRLHTKIQDEMNKTAASREEADFSKVAYAKGYCAYYETEYNTAIKEWGKYIEFAGVNNEISEYMKKVNNMINLKKLIEREAEIDAKAEEMLNAGIEKYNASKWVACIKDMEALQKFVTENKFSRTEEYYNKAKEYITLSANELAKAMKTEKKATSKPKEPEPQAVEEKQPEIDEAEADKKYNEGLVLYAQGKYLEAERTWELTLRLNPNHQKAKTALSKMRSKDN
ncbi:MAG: autotransporter outer membrane beta-barrel domain-containing protein, partial [Endomicrobia bacterium]|nr:autotransporter outer membrane beta-barrel domain-containing protein [Endomicrobiia bacterium]